MTRLQFVVAVGLAGFPFVAVAEPHGASSSVQMEDCAAYFRSKAPLPQALSALQSEIVSNLEMHVKLQKRAKDRASRAEVAFIRKVIKEHRAMSASARRLAKLMASASFTPAPHDMSKMDANAVKEMAKQAALQREFAALLTMDAAATEKMLSEMQSPPKERVAKTSR